MNEEVQLADVESTDEGLDSLKVLEAADLEEGAAFHAFRFQAL